MSKSAKSKNRKNAAGAAQLWLRLPGLVRDALYETVIGAGLACVDEVLEAERVPLCGARYVHLAERQALRAGRKPWHSPFPALSGRQHSPIRRPIGYSHRLWHGGMRV